MKSRIQFGYTTKIYSYEDGLYFSRERGVAQVSHPLIAQREFPIFYLIVVFLRFEINSGAYIRVWTTWIVLKRLKTSTKTQPYNDVSFVLRIPPMAWANLALGWEYRWQVPKVLWLFICVLIPFWMVSIKSHLYGVLFDQHSMWVCHLPVFNSDQRCQIDSNVVLCLLLQCEKPLI